MANFSGKYLKVWKVERHDKYTKVDLGDGKKDKNGNWQNWTWYNCAILGEARNVQLNEGDKVEVKSGIISMEKYNDKWSAKIVIFDIEVMLSAEGNRQSESFDDSVPF